jgi:hypothetical protein
MSTEIRINEDQTVSANWTGAKGRGSLFQSLAVGNCANVNELTLDELLEALVCSHANPFPVAGFTGSREDTLTVVQHQGETARIFPDDHAIRQRSLGEVRKALVYECGDSCNGPLDGWLRWFADRKNPQTDREEARKAEKAEKLRKELAKLEGGAK